LGSVLHQTNHKGKRDAGQKRQRMAMHPSSDQKAIKILIVDDDAFTRKIVRRVLKDLRFADISEAESGESALALLQGKVFDLIITDVQMPGINGLEVVRRIRAGLSGAAHDARIIVLTSFSNTEVIGAAMALDVNGFLVKPMKPAAVHDKIAQAMGDRASVRTHIGYQAVNTDLRTVDQPQTQPSPATKEEARGGDSDDSSLPGRRVPLRQLQPGMRLQQQVLTTDGTLLLSQGHMLNQLNINRLWDVRSILNDDALWIADEEAEPAAP